MDDTVLHNMFLWLIHVTYLLFFMIITLRKEFCSYLLHSFLILRNSLIVNILQNPLLHIHPMALYWLAKA